MSMHVKKGDTVEVISGEHRGVTGRVMKVIPAKRRVLVEGVNLVYKHVRPSQKNPQGGRIRMEQPINISNVLPVDPKSHKGSRVRFELDKKGGKKRVTLSGSDLGHVSKSSK